MFLIFLDDSCLSHAECVESKPFCYEGVCAPCSECQYCHDGIDNTCGSCGAGYPTREEGPCSLPEDVNQGKVALNGNYIKITLFKLLSNDNISKYFFLF